MAPLKYFNSGYNGASFLNYDANGNAAKFLEVVSANAKNMFIIVLRQSFWPINLQTLY